MYVNVCVELVQDNATVKDPVCKQTIIKHVPKYSQPNTMLKTNQHGSNVPVYGQ